MANYYQILGIKRDAKEQEIKAAYRRLAKKYHPDQNPGNQEARERFDAVAEAYEILGDQTKRQEYDQSLNTGSKPDEKPKTRPFYGTGPGVSPEQMQNMNKKAFEDFFGFTREGEQINKQKKKNNTSGDDLFERFFKR